MIGVSRSVLWHTCSVCYVVNVPIKNQGPQVEFLCETLRASVLYIPAGWWCVGQGGGLSVSLEGHHIRKPPFTVQITRKARVVMGIARAIQEDHPERRCGRRRVRRRQPKKRPATQLLRDRRGRPWSQYRRGYEYRGCNAEERETQCG